MIRDRPIAVLVALVDIFLLAIAFSLAFLIRFRGVPPAFNLQPFMALFPILALANVALLFGLGLYLPGQSSLSRSVRDILTSQAILFIVSLAMSFWLRHFAIPRTVLTFGVMFNLCLLVAWRSLIRLLTANRPRRVVVVSEPDERESLVRSLLADPSDTLEISYVATAAELMQAGLPILESVDLLILSASTPSEARHKLSQQAFATGTAVRLLPTTSDLLLVNGHQNMFTSLPGLELAPWGLKPAQAFIKRVLDIGLSSVLIVASSPVMLLIMAAIKLADGGPVFYRQERVGKGGRPFTIIKFRTMIVNAESQTGPVLAGAHDRRVTPVGKFLRRTRLDELPQFFNVLIGDMSLVGPRPERPVFVSEYADQLPGYDLRHSVAPGITGLAQIAGRYDSSAEEKLRYDLSYVSQHSILLDIQILLLTLRAVISGGSSVSQETNEFEAKVVQALSRTIQVSLTGH